MAGVTRRARSTAATAVTVPDAVVHCSTEDAASFAVIDSGDPALQKNGFELLNWNIIVKKEGMLPDDRVLNRLFLTVDVKFDNTKMAALKRKTSLNYGEFVDSGKYFHVVVGELVQDNHVHVSDDEDVPPMKLATRKSSTNVIKLLVHVNLVKKAHPFDPDGAELKQGECFYICFYPEVNTTPDGGTSLKESSGLLSWLLGFASDELGFDNAKRTMLKYHATCVLTFNPDDGEPVLSRIGTLETATNERQRLIFQQFWALTAESFKAKHSELYQQVDVSITLHLAPACAGGSTTDEDEGAGLLAKRTTLAIEDESSDDDYEVLSTPKRKAKSKKEPDSATKKKLKRALLVEEDLEVGY